MGDYASREREYERKEAKEEKARQLDRNTPMTQTEIDEELFRDSLTTKDIKFLREAAWYFRNRPTNGEDKAHWANVYNAENCEKIANRLAAVLEYQHKEKE